MQNFLSELKQSNFTGFANCLSSVRASIRVPNMVKQLKMNIDVDRRLIVQVTSASLVTLGVIYIGKIWHSYSFFEKRGIPTPKYRFFFGNVPDLVEKNQSECLQEWTEKYGKIYGYYEGHLPILVTSDIEMIEEIFYKQFSNFTARKLLPNQESDKSTLVNVFMASRNRWKRLRTITNPTFSPAKLKEMLPLMKMCSDRLMNVIENNQNKEINISEFFDRMSMDVVWTCLLGIDVDLQKNHEFIYFKRLREFLDAFANFDLFFKLNIYMREFEPIFFYVTQFYTLLATVLNPSGGNALFWLYKKLDNIINERKKSIIKKSDYVQILLDAEASNINLDFDNQHYDSSDMKLIDKKMSHMEILASLFVFMIAGYDTTSSTLGFCMHVLATHPDELVKLQEEIDTLNEFTHESLNKLEYLDLFIKEVMRMYSVANPVINRRCTKATTVKGIEIPEEFIIQVDVESLHYNPDYWGDVDPHVFCPQRFAPGSKINKMAYMPFGAGPRICVGMKFALLEMKVTLAKILKQFDVLAGHDFKPNIRMKGGLSFVRRPENPINVIFKRR